MSIPQSTNNYSRFLRTLFLMGGKLLHSIVLVSLIAVVQSPSHIRLFATPWTAACQASLSLTTSQSLPTFMSVESVTPFKCVLDYICFSLFSFPLSLLPWLRMLLIFTGFLTGLLTSFSTNSLAPSNHLL